MPRIQSQGVELYYETHGSGPQTLVFAHGMGGNAAIWFNQVAYFMEKYRIITFDHRHFARSSCTEDQFLPALFPSDILCIMDACEVSQAHFICQSMGGWTGSQLALMHPDRVGKLVMSHTPGVFVNRAAVNDARQVAAKVSAPAPAFGSAALAADFPARNPAGAVLYNQISAFNGINPAVVPKAITAAQLAVDTDTLSDYRIPTLFVSADQDNLFPASYIKALAATLPGARFVNLGDAGHSSYFEMPQAFNQTIEAFLEENPTG
ncbi:MAG: alpha/beta fold hydrolase [Pseudomonadota bacterium]